MQILKNTVVTILSSEAPVKALMTDQASNILRAAMEEFPFIFETRIVMLVHAFLPCHILVVELWVLNTLYFNNTVAMIAAT